MTFSSFYLRYIFPIFILLRHSSWLISYFFFFFPTYFFIFFICCVVDKGVQSYVSDVSYADGSDIPAAVKLAQSADAIVLVIGLTQDDEREGVDRSSLLLPGACAVLFFLDSRK